MNITTCSTQVNKATEIKNERNPSQKLKWLTMFHWIKKYISTML